MSDVHANYDKPSPNSGRMNDNKNRNMDGSGAKKRKSFNNNGAGNDNDANERAPKSMYNGSCMHRLTGAPAWNLEPQNMSAMTFTGRTRLFVANLPQSVSEESLKTLFSEFGQCSEIFIGKGNQFAFIKMDTRNNAENAKNSLDGKMIEGRLLRVRLAAHTAAIKVTNLPPCVSNELLYLAFSSFGPVERAIVIADDRGRSLNEGFVEFQRKASAQAAIKKCQNEALLLSSSPVPVVVTSLDARDDEEGVPEKNTLNNYDYGKEREVGPRFADPGTVEFEIANKWKQLFQIEAQRREAFEAEMKEMHDNFKAKMELFKMEETIKQLREQIRQMEGQTQQFNSEQEMRHDYERQREDERRQKVSMLRAQEEQLLAPASMNNNADMNTLRRQENELRQHANALQMMLDRQESSYRQIGPEPSMQPTHQMEHPNIFNQTSMPSSNVPGLSAGAPPPPQINPYGHVQQQAPVYGNHAHAQPQQGLMPPSAQPPPTQLRHPAMTYGNGMHAHQPPQAPPQQQPYHHNMGNSQNMNNNGGAYGKRSRNRY